METLLGRPLTVTVAQKAWIQELRRQGVTWKEVSKITGLTLGTCRYAVFTADFKRDALQRLKRERKQHDHE